MTTARTVAGVACALLVASSACRSRERAGAGSGLVAQKLPRVLYRGGPVLRHPRIITITFGGEDAKVVDTVERFGDVITRTAWWRAVVDAYCVRGEDCIGEGSSPAHVRLEEDLPAAMTDVELDAVLERAMTSRRIEIDGKDVLLLVYLPHGVVLRDAFVSKYCSGGPRAYHRSMTHEDRRVPYAVVPRCGDIDDLTSVASHELLETVTNPDPSRRGFAFEAGASWQGFTSAGVEPVDPCGVVTHDRHRTTESGFVVQRAWSNRAAALGHDPCVPAPPDEPYLALVPEEATVLLSRDGDEVTIRAAAAADRSTRAWAVSAIDLTGGQVESRFVDVSLDRTSVSAGETAKIRIKRLRRGDAPLDIVGLVSRQGSIEHLWPLAVVLR